MKNKILHGDCEIMIDKIKDNSVHLIFTSPPYFNAKDYVQYSTYDEYMNKMKRIIKKCYRVLNDGRFIVVNISPVIVPRKKRSESSKRYAIPFDFHYILTKSGFEFIDDIIWVKPEGAAVGRNKRFSIDRNPLQYKPNPITEYVLVYRKKSNKLIDTIIRNQPKEILEKSKIKNYESTNVWKINPEHCKDHPAIFPIQLAENVIKYYSFVGETVLDIFGGSGTTAIASKKLGRKYIYIEKEENYIKLFKELIISHKSYNLLGN